MVLGCTPHCVALRNASSHSGSTLGDALGRIYDRPTSLYRASKLVLMRFLRVADRFCGLQPFSSHWRGLRRDPSSAHPKITRDSRGGAFASAFICLIYLFFFLSRSLASSSPSSLLTCGRLRRRVSLAFSARLRLSTTPALRRVDVAILNLVRWALGWTSLIVRCCASARTALRVL